MNKSILRGLENSNREILFFGCILFFLYLVFRNIGLYPLVMPDEYKYILFSRSVDFRLSELPNYLYFYIYHWTTICGDGFFECSKLLNSLFFISSAPFIYNISRRTCNSALALLVTLLSVLGPINSYTAYFMPESLFFLGFWVLSWGFLRLNSHSHVRSWIFCGVIYGLTILIKPHSIFLLPGIFLYIMSLEIHQNKSSQLSRGFNSFFLVLGAALSVRLIIGYLLAGETGFSLLGSTYGGILTETPKKGDLVYRLLQVAMESLEGHLLAIMLIFSVPVCAVLGHLVKARAYANHNAALWKANTFTLIMILNLLAIVAIFTASVVVTRGEMVERLHMRYYNFALPLFYIISASALYQNSYVIDRWLRWVLATIFGSVALYALSTQMKYYSLTQVDCPELWGLVQNPFAFKISIFLIIASLIGWVAKEKIGLKIYLFMALPLCLLVSTTYVTFEQRNRLFKDAYDNAGLFARQYFPPEQRGSLLVVGSNLSGLLRTLSYLDSSETQLKRIEPGQKLHIKSLQPTADWVLAIGGDPLESTPIFRIPLNGFTLSRIKESLSTTVNFRQPVNYKKQYWPENISLMEGLSEPESWGTWTIGHHVKIDFASPLPEQFDILLTAHPFVTSQGHDITISIGNSSLKFRLDKQEDQTVKLSLNNPDHLSTLNLEIPQLTSPQSLGMNSDPRLLGIGLVELLITPNSRD